MAWLLLTASGHAVPLEFSVRPPDAAIYDGDQKLGDGHVRLDVDARGSHRFRLQRPPFDERTLEVHWNGEEQLWQLSDGTTLESTVPLELSRTFRLNAAEGELAWLPAARSRVGSDEGDDQVLTVDGVRLRVVPLARTPDGRVTLPNASRSQTILVARSTHDPLFAPVTVQLQGLDAESDLFPLQPVPRRPRYGWFSYWQFDTTLALALWLTGMGWGWWAWRRTRLRRAAERSQRLAALVDAARDSAAQRAQNVPPLEGQQVTTAGGEVFTVLKLLGRGGMGAVYEAVGTARDGEWALKILLSVHRDEYRTRFQREIQICMRLDHPGLVKILDWGMVQLAGEEQVWPFMIMERVSGQELRAILASRGRLPVDEATRWTIEILRAIHAAHSAGVLHRDLKPDNVIITATGHVKVLDFGIARTMDEGETRIIGTPLYMSPEHVRYREMTAASDIYSTGIILYEMLTGRTPIESQDTWSIMAQLLAHQFPAVQEVCPDVPDVLARIVATMLARSLSERYRTASDCIVDLQR